MNNLPDHLHWLSIIIAWERFGEKKRHIDGSLLRFCHESLLSRTAPGPIRKKLSGNKSKPTIQFQAILRMSIPLSSFDSSLPCTVFLQSTLRVLSSHVGGESRRSACPAVSVEDVLSLSLEWHLVVGLETCLSWLQVGSHTLPWLGLDLPLGRSLWAGVGTATHVLNIPDPSLPILRSTGWALNTNCVEWPHPYHRKTDKRNCW